MAFRSNKNKSEQSEVPPRRGEARSRFNLSHDTKRAVWGVIFLAGAALVALSFFNLTGRGGEIFYNLTTLIFGWGYYVLPAVFAAIGIIFLFGKSPVEELGEKKKSVFFHTLFGAGLFLLTLLGLFELFGQNFQGGWLGFLFAYPFLHFFGFWAALVIFAAGFLISVLIAANVSPRDFWQKRETVGEEKIIQEEAAESEVASSAPIKALPFFSPSGSDKIIEARESEPAPPQIQNETGRGNFVTSFFSNPPVFEIKKIGSEQEEKGVERELTDEEGEFETVESVASPMEDDYSPPSLKFLDEERGVPSSGDIRANANIIKRTLENFGIDVEMGEVNVGPTVTQYTLKPAQGIKLSRIMALQNDLALALAAHPIRIEAPIPGRSLVGIEIPNKIASLVRLKNLLEIEAFNEAPSSLTFALGRDVTGSPVYADLGRMPHLLIAGSTGSGKSVCIHDIIISFLYRNSPKVLKFIFIDPKRVELSVYNGIPHLLSPVITEGRKAINALRWAVGEMERRYEKLEQVGARDIGSYNSKINGKNPQDGRLPYIVIMIDELADLMAAFPREVEGSIVRLAQMARAVGIHLIVSTQRPSVEVIPGLIKANITSRIAFQVASQIDSRTILDMAGAEKLLGSGDMLFLSADSLKPRRIQGSFLTEQEIKKVVEYMKNASGIFGESGEVQSETGGLSSALEQKDFPKELNFDDDSGQGGDDELYLQARKLVVEAGKASASLLQRRLRIGYARAARLLDMLEEEGVIGPGDGAKPREILVSKEEYGEY